MINFSQPEKKIGRVIYLKFSKEKKKNARAPLISFKYLWRMLDRKETVLLKKIIAANPKDYGKNYTVYHGITPVPKNIIALKNQEYFSAKDKKIIKVKTQFLPAPVFRAFSKMKEAIKKDLGATINVTSGYRSPAYQAVILFLILFENKWNLRKTLRRVTLPGCSEHGYPKTQAIDVAPEKGIEKLENFAGTKEFKWMQKNAYKFGFYLPFPKDNKFGVMFEPWHWEHLKKQK